jgi:hypothetical protein
MIARWEGHVGLVQASVSSGEATEIEISPLLMVALDSAEVWSRVLHAGVLIDIFESDLVTSTELPEVLSALERARDAIPTGLTTELDRLIGFLDQARRASLDLWFHL